MIDDLRIFGKYQDLSRNTNHCISELEPREEYEISPYKLTIIWGEGKLWCELSGQQDADGLFIFYDEIQISELLIQS